MNREEAIAHGMEVHEIKHSMKRRCLRHDYYGKGIYMLTLVVDGRKPLFGALRGDSADQAHVELTSLGMAIKREEIRKISLYYPQVEVWKLCIMPDHLHMIVRVKEDLPKGRHLGTMLSGFMGGCSKAARSLGGGGPSCVRRRLFYPERTLWTQ